MKRHKVWKYQRGSWRFNQYGRQNSKNVPLRFLFPGYLIKRQPRYCREGILQIFKPGRLSWVIRMGPCDRASVQNHKRRQKSQVGEVKWSGKSERPEASEELDSLSLTLKRKAVTSQGGQEALSWSWGCFPSQEMEASALQSCGTEFCQQCAEPVFQKSLRWGAWCCRYLHFSPRRLVDCRTFETMGIISCP